jgi:glucose-1-phosphate cytidylyltransferase
VWPSSSFWKNDATAPGASGDSIVKAVILAGGLGSRLSEETDLLPKPMVEIGGKPILWHIMKMYAHHGVEEFVICLGYKGHVIKQYFADYLIRNSDFTVDLGDNSITRHQTNAERWRVTLVDTGEDTMTGGRLRRVRRFLDPQAPFCMTYGDGVSDVDLAALIAFHSAHGRLATVTVVPAQARFGAVVLDGTRVEAFREKPAGASGYINGGFFVLAPAVLDLIDGDDTIWERGPLEQLVARGELQAYRHDGFWEPMDTLREKRHLEALWDAGRAHWKVWA